MLLRSLRRTVHENQRTNSNERAMAAASESRGEKNENPPLRMRQPIRGLFCV